MKNNKLEGEATNERGPESYAARVSKAAGAANEAGRTPHVTRKIPRQQRSKEMVQAILQAAAEAFAQQGYGKTTTNKIALRAGVSVGSLYQYFPNKDSLLASLLAQHHQQVDTIISSTMRELGDHDTPLRQLLARLLTKLVALHQQDPTLTRALANSVLRESSISDQAHQVEHDLSRQRLLAKLLAARPDVRHGDSMAMAAVISQAVGHLTRWVVHDAPASLGQSTLVDEVVELLERYLRE